MKFIHYFSLLFFWAVSSCKENDGSQKILLNIPLERAEIPIFEAKTPKEIELFLDKNQALAKNYFLISPKNPASKVAQEIFQFTQNSELKQFYSQIQSEFKSTKDIENQLNTVISSIKEWYPQAKVPKIITMVSGFMFGDMFVSDSLIVIGLDYFVGEKGKFRPQVPGDYILKRYRREYIAPTIALQLSHRYNESRAEDKSLLAEMIYFGKGYTFAANALPEGTPDSLIIGYSNRQLLETEAAQDLVWGHFIDEKLVYETNELKKVKYTSERPFTIEIGPKCPGKIAHWLGWTILTHYLTRKPTTIPEFMKLSNAQKILQESGYRGEVPKE